MLRFMKCLHMLIVCRTQRNHCEYDFAGGLSDTDSNSLLETVEDFAGSVDIWMREQHPDLT